jgi:hypothetical protein
MSMLAINTIEMETQMTGMTRMNWRVLYIGMAALTFVFQIWVRSQQCVGLEACGLSYAKAAIWSAIWPGSWVVYLTGFVPSL